MKDVLIKDFCEKWDACEEGVEWAQKNCPTGMMSEAWDLLSKAEDNEAREYFIWVASRAYDDKTLRLLAVRMVRETPLSDGRKVVDLLTDQRSVNALVVAEKFALGLASQEELAAARAAAWAAAGDAAWAARAAAWAAGDAAWAAAWAAWAAGDAAWAARGR